MEYLKYVPPDIVAKEAREALAKRKKETPEELWERLLRIGLIRELPDGTVKVCFEREPGDNDKPDTTPD